MLTKHFFKTLILFSGMIIIGLALVFGANYFDKGKESENVVNTAKTVAK